MFDGDDGVGHGFRLKGEKGMIEWMNKTEDREKTGDGVFKSQSPVFISQRLVLRSQGPALRLHGVVLI